MREFDTLEVVTEGGILVATVNRPEARNALNKEAQRELRQYLNSQVTTRKCVG
jgi:enoyl-CoA hydratase/carnithine racemase